MELCTEKSLSGDLRPVHPTATQPLWAVGWSGSANHGLWQGREQAAKGWVWAGWDCNGYRISIPGKHGSHSGYCFPSELQQTWLVLPDSQSRETQIPKLLTASKFYQHVAISLHFCGHSPSPCCQQQLPIIPYFASTGPEWKRLCIHLELKFCSLTESKRNTYRVKLTGPDWLGKRGKEKKFLGAVCLVKYVFPCW